VHALSHSVQLAVLHPEQAAQLSAVNDNEVISERINALICDGLLDFSLELKIQLPDLYGVVYPCIGFFGNRLWIKYWI
jgi:hypothetical protein